VDDKGHLEREGRPLWERVMFKMGGVLGYYMAGLDSGNGRRKLRNEGKKKKFIAAEKEIGQNVRPSLHGRFPAPWKLSKKKLGKGETGADFEEGRRILGGKGLPCRRDLQKETLAVGPRNGRYTEFSNIKKEEKKDLDYKRQGLSTRK